MAARDEDTSEATPQSILQIDATRYRIEPGAHVHLDQIDTRSTGDFTAGKEAGKALLPALNRRLAELQEVFYAQAEHRLLVVLQAMDTGGKDSTIAHVFDKVNPQGVRVVSFKKPTAKELAHDFLWRIHPHVPGNGEIVIFNRSHYEDVLIARVHNLVPGEVWKRRYEHINAFEKMLVDEGTTVVKCFLHISKEEQRERLQARLDKPDKRWKFDPGDLAERERWHDYMQAYEDAIRHTSTAYAPWYVVPADRKWYRSLVVAQALVQTIELLKPEYPQPKVSLDGIVIH